MLVVAGLISLHNFLKQKLLFATWGFSDLNVSKNTLVLTNKTLSNANATIKMLSNSFHTVCYKKYLAHIILIIKITILYGYM